MGSTETTAVREDDYLRDCDFARHNAEQSRVWAAYRERRPVRAPVVLGLNTRYYMLSEQANPQHADFQAYTEDPDRMFDLQLQFARWSSFNLLRDVPLGLPERWTVWPDLQNYYEAAWFGCPVHYLPGQVPDTVPVFADAPERVMQNGPPDPLGGVIARGIEYHARFKDRAQREQYLGRPIGVGLPSGLGTDGPMTVACNLFGAGFVCESMLAEPDRLSVLLSFITDATIRRIQALRVHFGLPLTNTGFWFADDSCALLSAQAYTEHILPHHRKLCDTLAPEGSRAIHLCGDATRLFPTIAAEIRVSSFDTGFPVDFAELRRRLGPDIEVFGGPHIELLRTATEAEVRRETRRILASGIMSDGQFVLREGNNVAPGTPPANIAAMYRTAQEVGVVRPPTSSGAANA